MNGRRGRGPQPSGPRPRRREAANRKGRVMAANAKAKAAKAKAKKEEDDQLRKDYRELQARAASAEADRKALLRCVKDPRVSKLLTRFEREIEDLKEELTSTDKKNVEGMQAKIQARRELLNLLRNAHEDELRAAKDALRDFEKDHSLFLQSEATKEAQTAAKPPKVKQA